jgi:hypothetical protein
MNYDTLVENIKNGTISIGDDLWMTHVHYQKGKDDLLRNMVPTKVRIGEFTAEEKGYQEHEYFFNEVKDDGTIVGRGYRLRHLATDNRTAAHRRISHPGAQFFFGEPAAQLSYTEQCEAAAQLIQEYMDNRLLTLSNLRDTIDERVNTTA